MTGKRPGQHGVFDFFQKESADSRYLRIATSHDIHSETIWTRADVHGRRVTALNFPQMFPPPTVDGCIVPGGWMPWRQLRLGCHPSSLFDRLKALPGFDARELSLDMAQEEKALEGCAVEEYADWVALHTRRERRWFDILSYLMDEEPADLTAVLFDGVDKLQHLCWRFIDPDLRDSATAPWERAVADLCDAYFRQLDGFLEEIAGRAGPEAAIVVASDHGFGPTSDIFYVNTWLEQQGLLAWSSAGSKEDGDSRRVGIGHLARHVFELDWERTVAYAATPTSQGIHIVRRGPDGGPGVAPEAYEHVRDAIIEGLRQLRHPDTGRPVVTQITTREEAFTGPHAELGPDLNLLLEDNGVISILRSDVVWKRRPEPVGTHHPSGVFLARGPGLRAGAVLPGLEIVDVAPLLFHCLGVPIPDDLAGRLPVEAFEPGEILAEPSPELVMAPALAAEPASFADAEFSYNEEEEAIVLKRLKALGYLE